MTGICLDDIFFVKENNQLHKESYFLSLSKNSSALSLVCFHSLFKLILIHHKFSNSLFKLDRIMNKTRIFHLIPGINPKLKIVFLQMRDKLRG